LKKGHIQLELIAKTTAQREKESGQQSFFDTSEEEILNYIKRSQAGHHVKKLKIFCRPLK
jgi:hypothetical protein